MTLANTPPGAEGAKINRPKEKNQKARREGTLIGSCDRKPFAGWNPLQEPLDSGCPWCRQGLSPVQLWLVAELSVSSQVARSPREPQASPGSAARWAGPQQRCWIESLWGHLRHRPTPEQIAAVREDEHTHWPGQGDTCTPGHPESRGLGPGEELFEIPTCCSSDGEMKPSAERPLSIHLVSHCCMAAHPKT